MTRTVLLLMSTALLWGADDPWLKVTELKSRTELRIYKKGASQPIGATLDEANADRIIVVVKNDEMAIAKEDIDRIDARSPGKKPAPVVRERTAKTTEPDYTPHPPGGAQVPGDSYNTSVSRSIEGKPGFETVYRRQPVAPKNN